MNTNTVVHIDPKNWMLIILLGFLWGTSFVLFEIALEELKPMTVASMRIVTGAIFMFILFGNRLMVLKSLWTHRYRLAFLGLFGSTLPFACFAFGQQYINSSTAGVLNAMMPIFTFLIACLIKQENFVATRMIGLIVGVLGVGLLLGPEGLGQGTTVFGALLVILATLCYGIYSVTIKASYKMDISVSILATGMITWGAILSIPLVLVFDGLPPMDASKAYLASTAQGLFGTAVAYRIMVHVISKVGATNASISTFIIPIVAIIFGVLILDEQLNLWFCAGTAMIMFSMVLVDKNIRTVLLSLFRLKKTIKNQPLYK